MLTQDRHRKILELISNKGSVTVSELCDVFGASESTIRRDLAALTAIGKINKVRGGAMLLSQEFLNREETINKKVNANYAAKSKIAAYASSLIRDDDYVFIDCPAGIERGLRNVLNAGVDEVLLVVTPDDISVRSAERAVQVMEAKKLSRPCLIVNRLDADLIRSREMMSARTVAEVMDLSLLGEIPEDTVVSRAMLRHSLFIAYDCEARNAVLRIASRLRGGSPAFPMYGCKKQSFLQRIFSRSVKEVIPLDDH